MEPLIFFSIVLHIISGIILIILGLISYLRNPKYQGNQYLAIAYMGLFINTLMTVIYNYGFNEIVTNIALRIGTMGIIFGIPCLMIGIWTFCESWIVVKQSKFFRLTPWIIGVLWIIVWIPNFIVIIPGPSVIIQRFPPLMIIISIWLYTNLIYILIRLRRVISRSDISDINVRQKLKRLMLGSSLTFGIPITSMLEGITGLVLFNILQSLFAVIISSILAWAILKRTKNKE